jgi:hypothetical protein
MKLKTIFDKLNFVKRLDTLDEQNVRRDQIIADMIVREKEHEEYIINLAETLSRVIGATNNIGVQLSDVAETVYNKPPNLIDIDAEDLTIPSDLNLGGMRHG